MKKSELQFKYILIGAGFVGAFLLKEKLVEKVLESDKITPEKINRVENRIKDITNQSQVAYNEVNHLLNTFKGVD